MERPNPFIAGPPIEDENRFFGRDALLQNLLQQISDGDKHSFLLYGPRRIGKTTILKQLEYHLSDEGFTQIYFDLTEKSTLYLNELLYEISQAIANACAFEAPRFENFDRDGRYFIEVFLPMVENASEVGAVALLFDHFEVDSRPQPEPGRAEFLPFLAHHFSMLRNTKIICSLNSHSSYLKLMPQFDYVAPVPRFNRRSFEMLLQQSGASPLHWHPAAFDILWKLTGGHPYVSQIFGKILWERLLSSDKPLAVDPPVVNGIRAAAVPYLKPLFQATWHDLSKEEQDFFKILLQKSDGPISLDKMNAQLGRNGRASRLNSILGRFRTLDIIEHVDSEQRHIDFAIPLFKDWVVAQNAIRTEQKAPSRTQPKPEHPSPGTHVPDSVNRSSTGEAIDWEAALSRFELEVADNPHDKTARANLRHARNQVHLARRYNKALEAISCSDYEGAQKLLAEVILRDPGYREASRYLLLATTGIDTKELKHKMEREQSELQRAKAQIKMLQAEIVKSQSNDQQLETTLRQIDQLKTQIASSELRESENQKKLHTAKQTIQNLRSSQVAGQQKTAQDAPKAPAGASAPSFAGAATTAARTNAPSGTRLQTPKAAASSLPSQQAPAKQNPISPPAASQVSQKERQSEPNAKLHDSLKMLDSILSVSGAEPTQPEAQVRTEAAPEHESSAQAKSTLKAKLEQAALKQDTPATQPAKAPAVSATSPKPAAQKDADHRENQGATAAHVPEINRFREPNQSVEPLATKPAPERKKMRSRQPESAAAFTDTSTIEAGTVKRMPDESSWMSAKTEEPKRTPPVRRPAKPRPQEQPVQQRPSPAARPNFNSPARHTEHTPARAAARPGDQPRPRESMLAQRHAARTHKRKRAQASWITATLNVLPVFLWSIWLWAVQPLEWGNGGKFIALIGSVPAWLVIARYGASDKEKHIRSFVGMAPVVAFTFFAVLITETLRPGIPPFTQGSDLAYFGFGLLYFLIVAVFSVQSGKVASTVSISCIASAPAAAALFLMGGGSIEATVILATISAIMLLLLKVEISSALSAGVASAIPAGFLLFALTNRTVAGAAETIVRASTFSLVSFFITAGFVYAIFALLKKMTTRSIL